MSPLALPVAQGFDVVGVVIVILTVIVFMVAQLINKLAEQQRAGKGAAPRPAPPLQEADVEEEIDEFVRRAAQRSSDRPQPTPRPDAQPLPPARMGKRLPTAEVVEEVPVGRRVPGLGDELTARGALPIEEPAAPARRPTAVPPTAAAGLAALFGSAQSIRQAIIINEILRRPEDRWG